MCSLSFVVSLFGDGSFCFTHKTLPTRRTSFSKPYSSVRVRRQLYAWVFFLSISLCFVSINITHVLVFSLCRSIIHNLHFFQEGSPFKEETSRILTSCQVVWRWRVFNIVVVIHHHRHNFHSSSAIIRSGPLGLVKLKFNVVPTGGQPAAATDCCLTIFTIMA